MSQSTTYAFQSIAASGIAVMSHRIAFQLRGDLWSDIQGCLFDFEKEQKIEGAKRVMATFPSFGDVQVYARSLDSIEKRLHWIVGEAPMAIVDWQPEAPPAARTDFNRLAVNAKVAEHLEQVRKLSKEVPPSHDCQHRRDILAARKELGLPIA